MASLIESTQWEASIYQLETTDPVKGGNDGISNLQGKQLANRTAYLKQQVELKAPIASPTFTGVPVVPTAAADTSTTQVASTAFVVGQAATVAPVVDGVATVGTSKKFARQDHAHPTDTTRAPLASPTFTGVPEVPTAAAGTNTTQVANTAFVATAIANLVNSSPGTLDTLNELAAALGDDPDFATTMTNALAGKAPLTSPTFTGVPAVPTAAADTNTTQVASTAFVLGQVATVAPVVDGVAAVGTSKKFARQDHVHPTDTTRAPLASPIFTGVPAVPTAAVDTNTTQAASTAFVIGQVQSGSFGYSAPVDVTASRAFNTTYYNTSNKPKKVKVFATLTTTNGYILILTVNGVVVDNQGFGGASSSVTRIFSVEWTVAPGESYAVSYSTSTPTLTAWIEA